MKSHKKEGLKVSKETLIMSFSIAIFVAAICFDSYLYWQMREENILLKQELIKFETALSLNQRKLSSTTEEKIAVSTSLIKEKENTNFFQNQIQTLAGTVGVLEKLSKTDTELLKKYSKIYFLNENYVPPKVVSIPEQYLFDKNKIVEIHEQVLPHLKNLLDAAEADGVKIQIASGYRSFGTQAGLKSGYKVTYGVGANKFSADQGYSEHQLATTLDFTSPEIGGALIGFDKTTSYAWLLSNAHRFGFTLSYPKGNAYYIYEPWHWRFVSISFATNLHNDSLNFYDLDQRVIDQYLLNFFD